MKLLQMLLMCLVLLAIMLYPEFGYKKHTVTVTFGSNDTIWSIAEEYIDKQDKRMSMNEFLWHIEQENNKEKLWNTVQVGDEIVIPLYKKDH